MPETIPSIYSVSSLGYGHHGGTLPSGKADIQGHILEYNIGAIGQHVALNSLGTLLAAVTAGGDLEACAMALTHYNPPKGRGVLQDIALQNGTFTLIDESYNASPIAVRAAIRVLAQIKKTDPSGKRIMVLGDMKELGMASAALHAELADDLVSQNIDRVFCCGEMMSYLFNALPESLPFRSEDREDSRARA